jgi:hypothetical protein
VTFPPAQSHTLSLSLSALPQLNYAGTPRPLVMMPVYANPPASHRNPLSGGNVEVKIRLLLCWKDAFLF